MRLRWSVTDMVREELRIPEPGARSPEPGGRLVPWPVCALPPYDCLTVGCTDLRWTRDDAGARISAPREAESQAVAHAPGDEDDTIVTVAPRCRLHQKHPGRDP